jgi:hypothetical protein
MFVSSHLAVATYKIVALGNAFFPLFQGTLYCKSEPIKKSLNNIAMDDNTTASVVTKLTPSAPSEPALPRCI